MWDFACEGLSGGRARRFILSRDRRPARYEEVVHHWRRDPAFGAFFAGLLAEAPFAAFRWETPPVTQATFGRGFEFVLIDAPGLERAPDLASFSDQLGDAPHGETVIAFPNLANDAVLVVPRPVGPSSAYGHLAAFVRQAPPAQVRELWRVVAAVMEARLGESPLWLSTAGMGVSWLHVRLDSRPKYYGYRPYTRS
jgi:hypothetical protein